MFAATTFALSVALAAAHPGLFFSADDVPHLRGAAATTHQEIANHLTSSLSVHFNDPAPSAGDYDDPRLFGRDVAAWAFAYQLTGDSRYAAQARLRLMTYLGWSDWGFGEAATSGGPDLNTAHFMLGVACAYDWLYSYLSASDRSAIATRLGSEAQKMAAYLPGAWWEEEYVQNHNWIDTAGLGLAGLVLSGEDSRAAGWVQLAQGYVAKIAEVVGSGSDGSWHEGLRYQDYGLSTALPFWMALARSGSDYTDMGILRGIGKMFLAATLPDSPREQLLLHGDFTGWPTGGMVQVLRYSAAKFRDGAAESAAQRWLSAGGRSPLPPDLWFVVFEFLAYDPTVQAVDPHSLPLDTYLPDLQATVMHSTWDSGDLALAFKAGPYGGRFNFDRMKTGGAPGGHLSWGHDHNDDMSFWFYGNGTWLAPEAAGYDAGVNSGYSAFAHATQYHNGLLVDGNGELGDVRTSDNETNNPWFFDRDAVPLLDPTSTADYAFAGGRGASLYDPNLGLTRWDRLVVLARNRYAVVRDDIAAATNRTFDWLCHFSDGVDLNTAGWVQGLDKNGMSLGVRVISPASWTASTGAQGENLTSLFEADGSISYVKLRPSSATSAAQFLTALVPVPTSSWNSRVSINALSSTDPGAGMVVAPGSALEERWIFSSAGGDGKAAADLALTASLAGMAGYSAGQPKRALIVGPGKLSDQQGGRELLSSHSARSLEADLQGTTLVVTGDAIRDFRAFAPGVSQVTVNGRSLPWTQDGTAVQFTAPAGVDTGGAGPTVTGDSSSKALFMGGGCAVAGASLWTVFGLVAALRARRRKQSAT
ncbi:MAG TPA: DUF4962 domain-containing protein [Myxococcales bacterium]|nr:DUF4962 domain-containing protein [Myxococcales bacterium]